MFKDKQITITQNQVEQEKKRVEKFKFKERLDADGVREIISIGNEREGGCPFSCVGCGVHSKLVQVKPDINQHYIEDALNTVSIGLESNQDEIIQHGYHVCIYNEGNVTNKEELSRENLFKLLNGLSNLNPLPKHVSLNSRGVFIDKELLDDIDKLDLPYNIHFILGVESLTDRGSKIYGKKNIAKELKGLFQTLQDKNQQEGKSIEFGLDAGFVFLPEFYLEDGEPRENKEKIKKGFVEDIKTFIDQYSGKGVPTRINLHPYYEITDLPYSDSHNSFNSFMKGVAELISIIRELNKNMEDEEEKVALFIGVQGDSYDQGEWKRALEIWNDIINRLNALKDYDSEECDKIIREINLI